MRAKFQEIVNHLVLKSLPTSGGNMPENWEWTLPENEWIPVWFSIGYETPRQDAFVSIPHYIKGEPQIWQYADINRKITYISGFYKDELMELAKLKTAAIVKAGRDLRDEFDGDDCPQCGRRFCTLNWTKVICQACEDNGRYEAEKAYERMDKVQKHYHGTHLFKQFEKAGIPEMYWR